MKKLFLFIAFVFGTFAVSAQSLSLDVKKSSIEWTGKKVGGQHNGHINFASGELVFKGDVVTGGNFVVDMKSISNVDIKDEGTNATLVGHLKSDDFFGVDNYPVAKLVIDKGTKSGSDYSFTGKLRIKDITNPVIFKAKLEKGDNGAKVFKGQLVVDRSLYNVRYGSGKFFSNLGDNLIYDDFSLDFKVVLNK